MTKKGHQKSEFFSEKVKLGKFSTESEKFFENTGGNLKHGENASLPQGDGLPWNSARFVQNEFCYSYIQDIAVTTMTCKTKTSKLLQF